RYCRRGNIGVLTGDDGVFVIDSQFANTAPKNLSKINEISGSAPTYLVNTHWHGDHTGGNANFGATIIAHENVRVRLSTDQRTVLLGNERTTPAAAPAARPVITFNETLSLHLNGQTISIFHAPAAHTDGDAIVHFKDANVIQLGDVFSPGRFPFIDISSGGSLDGTIAALTTVLDLCNGETVVIPGRGPLSNISDIQASRDMLVDVREIILRAIADGMSADEAVTENLLADLEADWGGGVISAEIFTRLIYDDLSRNTSVPEVTRVSPPSSAEEVN
ncbi:MAG: MBL fold metallo-hydrolase, partial [Pseudomonadota bacterium]